MNHNHKLGYMALGAGVMALGIIIGQWGTPDIEAQADGVFNKIQCRQLEVIDENGNSMISLVGRMIAINEERGKPAIWLYGGGTSGNQVFIFNPSRDAGDSAGIALQADSFFNRVSVDRRQGGLSIELYTSEFGDNGRISIYHEQGKLTWSTP